MQRVHCKFEEFCARSVIIGIVAFFSCIGLFLYAFRMLKRENGVSIVFVSNSSLKFAISRDVMILCAMIPLALCHEPPLRMRKLNRKVESNSAVSKEKDPDNLRNIVNMVSLENI